MSLVEHARKELAEAGLFDIDSDYDGMLGEAVLELIQKFSEQGHSGMSASMTISLFEKLARFKPLTPLTGEDDEWIDVDDNTYQNRRHPSIFKDQDGQAYWYGGVVFKNQDGATFTNEYSRVPVTFPYTPTEPTIVEVYERD